MYFRPLFLILCWLLVLTTACKTSRSGLQDANGSLEEVIRSNSLLVDNFSGIYIEKLANNEVIYQQLADHRFIPASNIKILTLYAALEGLGEKIPSFQYLSERDTLWIWGTGDPGFLYDQVAQDPIFNHFIQSRSERTLLFSTANFTDERFGAGWAWDDYSYTYQVEKSPFPIYGNRVTFTNPTGNRLLISPTFFEQTSVFNPDMRGGKITRSETKNQFSIAKNLRTRKFKTTRPFHHQPELIAALLTDTLKRKIIFDPNQRPLSANKMVVERKISDELYQKMMQESDNFIAEQLLLTLSGKLTDTLNTRQIISQLERQTFRAIADDIRWVDGSGLSRYNLLTPRSIAWVLRKLPETIATERLLDLFPAGGVSGSLKNWYGGKDRPYVFAKTGSMSGVYCLSGYLKNKKGKLLIISFMHNNFRGSSKKYKTAMEPILEWLYEN